MEKDKPTSIRNILKHYDYTKRSYQQMVEKQDQYTEDPSTENLRQMNTVIEQIHAYEKRNHIGRNLGEILGELYDSFPDLVKQLKHAAKEQPELLDAVATSRHIERLDRYVKEHGKLTGHAALKILCPGKPDISM